MRIVIFKWRKYLIFLPIICFAFFGIVYPLFSSKYNYFYLYFIYGCIYVIPFGIFIGIGLSVIHKNIKILIIYIISIILSLFILCIIFRVKCNIWENEMNRISEIIEKYYMENSVVELDKNDLYNLGIKENIYVKINEDETYFIVNKEKNIVYSSKYDAIWEEDGDY